MWQVMKTVVSSTGAVVTSSPVGKPYADKERAERFAERCSGAEDYKSCTVYQVVPVKS